MENEQDLQPLVQLLGELVTAAGPEWTMQFLQAGLEEAANAGGAEMPPEVMSEGGPGAMPPPTPSMPGRGMMGRKIN
jgi:hypothetical protein